MKLDTEFKTYEERVETMACVSLSFTDDERESYMSISNSNFYDLNNSKANRFSLVERDDKKGFNVFINGVTIVPDYYICIGDCPIWMQWVIRKLCKRVI